MAQSATVHTFTIDLADMDRGVYERLELRVARHPSEAADFLVARILAYCLEYTDGIAFSQGIAAGDEPAVWVKDATGRVTAWIEVGLPDAERLHRGSKLAERAAVYTHRDVTQLLAQLAGKKIYRAEAIPVYALERRVVAELAGLIERRTALALSVTERQLYAEIAGRSLATTLTEHRIT
ncbi:MAG: YaeQ family protein [Blastochloris sp.]|nr:YaeQ family protein [Blastochloris sp.]